MKRFLFITLFAMSSFAFAACDDETEVCVIDGYCDVDETYGFCPEDCDPICNDDGICDPDWEDAANCPYDCGTAICIEDGFCDEVETYANCPADCDPACNDDGICDEDWEDADNCPNDCGIAAYCGDGNCDDDETYADCPEDCDAYCSVDGSCDANWEDLYSCAEDCALIICGEWSVWVDDLGCEDGATDVCTTDIDWCEANLIDLADAAMTQTEIDEVDLVEQCAYELGADDGTCTDVLIGGVNCAELLITEGYGEMTCAKK